jgi:hypothetical protein
MDYLRANPRDCFEEAVDVETLAADRPCGFSACY